MSSLEDRELLRLAAKAAGYPIHSDAKWVGAGGGKPSFYMGLRGPKWNPLEDDGDAFRLANQMNFWIERGTEPSVHVAQASWSGEIKENYASHDGDKDSATRRAIVRAAAEIGRSMP